MAAAIDGAAKQYLTERPKAFDWYLMGPLVEVDTVLLERVFDGDVAGFFRFGEFAASRDLRGVLKALLWLAGTPNMIAGRFAQAYAKYYTPGEMSIDEAESNRCVMSLRGAVLPYHQCMHLIPGWVTRAMTMTGARGLRTEHVACQHQGDPICQWEANW